MPANSKPISDSIEDDEILARLAELPAPQVDAAVSQRIQRRARIAFVQSSEAHPWLAFMSRWYNRIEPVMATSVAAGYLLWAFQSVSMLYLMSGSGPG